MLECVCHSSMARFRITGVGLVDASSKTTHVAVLRCVCRWRLCGKFRAISSPPDFFLAYTSCKLFSYTLLFSADGCMDLAWMKLRSVDALSSAVQANVSLVPCLLADLAIDSLWRSNSPHRPILNFSVHACRCDVQMCEHI